MFWRPCRGLCYFRFPPPGSLRSPGSSRRGAPVAVATVAAPPLLEPDKWISQHPALQQISEPTGSYSRLVACHPSSTSAGSGCLSSRVRLPWESSLQRRYPPSRLCQLPSQPSAVCPALLPVAGPYSISHRSRLIKSWSGCLAYSPSPCVARCRLRPREWGLSLVWQKSGRFTEPAMPGRFSPFR